MPAAPGRQEPAGPEGQGARGVPLDEEDPCQRRYVAPLGRRGRVGWDRARVPGSGRGSWGEAEGLGASGGEPPAGSSYSGMWVCARQPAA